MSDFTENIDLPTNWALCTFSDISEGNNAIVDGPFGSNLKTSDYIDDKDNGVPVLTTKNLEGDYSDSKVRFISKEKFEELRRSQVNPGDILVAKIGSIGKTGVYPKNARTAIIPANLLKFTVSRYVIFNYVYSYLNFFGLQNKIKAIATATAQPAFNVTKFRLLEIPLPPLPEQHRIVAKIEELFSSLDKGIESLKTVQTQLKTYRQAVLKWAFDGKLTNQNVKEGELPEGWKWQYSIDIFEYVTSGSRGWAKYYSDAGSIFLRMGNLDHDTIALDLSDIQYVKLPNKAEGTRSLVRSGDILISITADVGMIGIVPEGFPEGYINQHVALARPKKKVVQPTYVAWYLASKENGQKQFRDLQRGATKVGLGLDDIKSINVPIPPLSEQHRIVSEIETRLSVCDKLEESITQSLVQAEALRQSILKKAFEGKLVPQNPNDLPASVLLERIRAERASVVAKNATTATSKRRRGKRT
jgi:type I restriction enzyme S subunit